MFDNSEINQYICTMIFYLSGTGNSLWAAEVIAKETGDSMISITDALKNCRSFTLADGERIGFVFPVHGWRPPKTVRRFVEKITFANTDGHYVFALVTAGDNIGETIGIFESDLRKKDICLDAAFSLIMPESYVGLPFMDVDTIEKEKIKKENSARRISSHIKVIMARESSKRGLDIGRWPRINSRIIGGFFTRYLITDRPFHVTEDKCVKCGLCAEVCPVADINGGKGKIPEWRHNGNCMTCFSCYHHCPNHAIEFGGRTRKKGQYYFGNNKNTKVYE